MSYLRMKDGVLRNQCHPRRRFAEKSQAMAASIRIANSQKVQRLPEPCSKCRGWHLSEVLP